MQPDPKEAPKQPPPSEQVENAHAAGDGALERSDGRLEAGGETLHAEDQDHKPY